MTVIHTLRTDLVRRGVTPRVYAMQFDGNTRVVELVLTAQGEPWTPPAEAGLALAYRKADGTRGYYNRLADDTGAIAVSENKVSVTLAHQVLTAPGIVEAALVILISGGERVAAFPFEVHVAADPSGGTTQSDDYFNGGISAANAVLYIQQALTDEQKAQARANIGAADGAFFAEVAIPSKNLLNPDTVTPGYFTNWSNGNLASNANKECSDFIAVTPGEILVASQQVSGTNYRSKLGLQYPTFYDADKKYLSGQSAASYALTVPLGAAYVRVTFTLGITENNSPQIEVSADGNFTEYEPYGTTPVTKLRSDIPVPEVEAARGGFDTLGERLDAMSPGILNLPPKLYALVGEELNIYFDNLVDGHDTDYRFDVTCSVGMQLERCYRLIPEAAGTYDITVSATDKQGITVKKSGTIYVADTAAGNGATKNLIVLGDSTTNNGIMITKLNENFAGDVMGVTTLGTRGTSPNNHEGRSGWTFRQYFETQVDANLPDVVNPFYNPSTKTFDAAYYFANSGVEIPDWFFIHLGINDTFGYGDDAALADAMPALRTYCGNMITSLKAAAPDMKIGICLTIPPNYSQDAFGKAYQCGQTRNRYKRNNVLWVQEQIKAYGNKESEHVYLVPIHTNLDTRYNMGMEQISHNKRNAEKYASPIANGGVHPVESGYWQIADALWFFLKNQV